MVLAVALPSERLSAGTLEVQAGGVHEHHRQLAEQVAAGLEHPLLDHVLETARGERRAVRLFRPR
jgi:hypothetical protein